MPPFISYLEHYVIYLFLNENGVAHRLAKLVLHISSHGLWFEETLDFLVDILFENCNF